MRRVAPTVLAAALALAYLIVAPTGADLPAQLLRVKRKEIRKTEPISCVVDLANDPHEISLDENVTRSDMHPADQFEAFRDFGLQLGFKMVFSGPLVRSSYMADLVSEEASRA